MTIKFEGPFHMKLGQGEEVTIRVMGSVGVLDALNYSLDGTVLVEGASKTEAPTFKLHTSGKLGVFVPFSQDAGGHFTLRITGNEGEVHTRAYSQSPGESFMQIVFLCDIEGNPTTDW